MCNWNLKECNNSGKDSSSSSGGSSNKIKMEKDKHRFFFLALKLKDFILKNWNTGGASNNIIMQHLLISLLFLKR
jgi:hypothetical protein